MRRQLARIKMRAPGGNMKKLVLICCLMVLVTGISFSQSAGSVLYVAVKTADLKNGTGFFARSIETLNLGDSVTVVRESGNWLEVRSSRQTGWVLRENLTTRRVVASGSATASDLALAGKGFSAEAEVQYRRDGLDFTAVDTMERILVAPADLERFVTEGRLKRGE